jgi:hypothetical protein
MSATLWSPDSRPNRTGSNSIVAQSARRQRSLSSRSTSQSRSVTITEKGLLGVWKVLGRVAVRSRSESVAGVVGFLHPGSRCEVSEIREIRPGHRMMFIRSRYGASSMAICKWRAYPFVVFFGAAFT